MINLFEYIKYLLKDEYLIEMATIGNGVKLDNKMLYKIAIHVASSKDRNYPHIHIYDFKDLSLKKFNFEISLVDILCYDEINLIAQIDKYNNIKHMHRKSCTWEGYRKLYNGFEDWLFSNKVEKRGEYIDNLDAIIWACIEEGKSIADNFILYYIKEHGMKVLNKYKKYFSD